MHGIARDADTFGIVWKPEGCVNRMAEPFEEIDRDEWLYRTAVNSPLWVHFEQSYLDWGSGPLIENPIKAYIVANNTYYDITGLECILAQNYGFNWQEQPNYKVIKIDGSNGSNSKYLTVQRIDRPELDIPWDVPVRNVAVQNIYYGSGGWSSLENFWNIRYIGYQSFCLAVASHYLGEASFVRNSLGKSKDFLIGKGHFLKQGNDEYGYALRYFRVGCQHKKGINTYPAKFTTKFSCPDCGYTAAHDTSG